MRTKSSPICKFDAEKRKTAEPSGGGIHQAFRRHQEKRLLPRRGEAMPRTRRELTRDEAEGAAHRAGIPADGGDLMDNGY
jgi:hypothetical protein